MEQWRDMKLLFRTRVTSRNPNLFACPLLCFNLFTLPLALRQATRFVRTYVSGAGHLPLSGPHFNLRPYADHKNRIIFI